MIHMDDNFDLSKRYLTFPLHGHGSLVMQNLPECECRERIEQTLHGCGVHDFTVTPGNVSGQGSFRIMKITATFNDIATFRMTTTGLARLPGARMLI